MATAALKFRPVTAGDLPELFAVRTSVRENAYTLEELHAIGITETSVAAMLATSHRGWLCLDEDQVCGFIIANGQNGELWVIAVRPEVEGRGIGTQLYFLAEDWLRSLGWKEIWLWTSLDTSLKAYSFYRKHGWGDSVIEGDQRIMKKFLSPALESKTAVCT